MPQLTVLGREQSKPVVQEHIVFNVLTMSYNAKPNAIALLGGEFYRFRQSSHS